MLITRKSIILASALVIALGGSSLGAGAQGTVTSQSIGIVDTRVVYEKFPKIKQFEQDEKKEQERLHKLLERSNKEFQNAKKQKKPKAELQAMEKRLQGQINAELAKYQKTSLVKKRAIQKQFDDAVRAEAKAKKLNAVFDKMVVLVGGVDITDGVVKRLAASQAATTQ